MIKFKLDRLLEENNITRNALAREAKIRPNVVYEMCNNETKRIELKTLDKILETLNRMTNRPINVSDIIEYVPDDDDAADG